MTEISSATGVRSLLARALADVGRRHKPLGRRYRPMVTCPPFHEPRPSTRTSMPKISAYILSYNEAEKIEAAVSSVLWADEVVVVDSFSTARTGELARALGG